MSLKYVYFRKYYCYFLSLWARYIVLHVLIDVCMQWTVDADL